jgi:hypothetical protein
VRFGESIFAEAFDLLEDLMGELFGVMVLRMPLMSLASISQAAPASGGHRTAQVGPLAGREVGSHASKLHDLPWKIPAHPGFVRVRPFTCSLG